ncbi:MAG: PEP-CTERM sorting domain-containing protein [Hydrococcus sp. Prado102]|jgi:hypothetical protein|nr:PEP-CTERM sorting domain-containing protein [Hydrococcus sp. Prado102]
MVAQRQKIGAIAQSSVSHAISAVTLLSLSVVKVEPAQAAYFYLEFMDDLNNDNYAIGNAIFQYENTSLTGIGQETISLSQLKQENKNSDNSFSLIMINNFFGGYYEETRSPYIFYNFPDDTTLNLNNGKLTGINFAFEANYDNYSLDKYASTDGKGIVSFSGTGDRFEILFTGTVIFNQVDYSNTGQLITTTKTYNKDPIQSGSIRFAYSQLSPPDTAAVPEPLTCMGALTALGFGIALKRKLARKS